MLCRNPYMSGGTPFGCGQCLPCRINRRRQWTWRQYLESLMHEENCFITLTYDEAHLPEDQCLHKKHVQDWLHRLRKAILPAKVRYFLVGEYGPSTLRPHYHATLFGMGVAHSALVQEVWGQGFTHTAEFNEQTAQYVSGYVVKKLTDASDPRLSGKSPEFALMSRRPGIGSSAMKVIAEALKTTGGQIYMRQNLDVPNTLSLGRRSIPLGRFLLNKLRLEVGMTPDDIQNAKDTIAEKQTAELFDLWLAAKKADPNASRRDTYLESVLQKIRNTESRALIFKKRDTL